MIGCFLIPKFWLISDKYNYNNTNISQIYKKYPLINTMIGKLHSIKAKNVIIFVIVVLIWQFSFPSHATTAEIIISQDNEQSDQCLYIEKPLQSDMLPDILDKPQPEAKESMYISVTAYSSTPDQTSGDPFITASGTRVHDGVIAANFLPIGTKVRFPEKFGNKIFIVEDRMSSRYWHRADIWMPTREQAKEWGVKYTKIEII